MNKAAKQIKHEVPAEHTRNNSTRANDADSNREALPHSPAQTAAYISDLLRELQQLAERSNMMFLAYLLDIAQEEAEAQKNQTY